MHLKTVLICSALAVSIGLTACQTTDASFAKATQCNNLRNQMWQIQSNPQKLKMNIATRQYNNMRVEYGNLDCGDFRDYIKSGG